jgi:serine/threonine-protein kinase
MTVIARQPLWWLADDMVVADHTIEKFIDGRHTGELRYHVRAPDGTSRLLLASRHPYRSKAARTRFHRQAARRIELDHHAAIPVRAVAEHAGHPMLITDPSPETTLADLLEYEAPLPPATVVKMIAPVAEALDLAHARGLVHLTLGADTILLAGRDRLVLHTFGLLAGEEWTISRVRDLRYRPPEQARGDAPTPPANVYSLGAVLTHALTGAPPYRGGRAAILHAHLADPPPSLEQRVPELGHEIDAVIARAMAKAPADRYDTVAALVRAVAVATGVAVPDIADPSDSSVPGPRLHLVGQRREAPPVPQPTPAPRAGRRRLAVAAVVGALALGALGAVALSPFGHDDPVLVRAATPAAWSALDGRRTGIREELAAARTPNAQASAASRLAGLYAAAARADGPPALRAAAGAAGSAYARLAAAAQNNDAGGYAEAASAVERAEGRLSLAASRH